MSSARLLPAGFAEGSPWDQALYAFLVEKGNRSGSRRTVEGYGRMLWPLVTANPCDAVERPRSNPSPARGYSPDEVRRLLAVVPDTVVGRRDRALLLMFVLKGRRRSEVIGLTAGDISVEGETVFYIYRPPPGERERMVARTGGRTRAAVALATSDGTGRSERPGASLTQQAPRFVMINRTPTDSLPAAAQTA